MVTKQFQNITLSRLGMGNMRLPILPGGKDGDIDYEKAGQILDYAMENGINYFDSAYVYHSGQSERFVGQALRRYPRDSYYITTKYNVLANPDYRETFAQQLERYGVDRIDFYLIHALGDSNIEDYLHNGCIPFFQQMKREGKISYFGFSSHASPEVLARFADAYEWDFAQIQLNYFDWNYGTAKREYEILAERNIPVMVMESVRGGRLAKLTEDAESLLRQTHPDWSIPSWAFRWLKRLPMVQVALSGMSNLEQIQDNVATFADDRALTDEEEALLFRACAMFHDQVRVPCTGCRYCCDTCPAGINIPEVLKVYNSFKLEGAWALNGLKNVEGGMPWDCVGCGACAQQCPQNIRVPQLMEEMTKAAGK